MKNFGKMKKKSYFFQKQEVLFYKKK